ncbi:MAG: hypothetical protein KTR29_17885 [Rhodothermaceae bacterium]|nr:hypothetical protein [Rhodothermaceae bacterium]
MTPEEYQRIKEAEKQHLQAIKKLKAKLRQVEQRSGTGKKQNSLQKALDEIENAPGPDILDTHEEMIDRLAMDAIHQEARLELALSSEKDMDVEPASNTESEGAPEAPSRSDMLQSDEELKELRAKELVRKMKIQMGLDNLKRKQEPVQNVTKKSNSENTDASNDADSEDASEELPEKTIGRIPKK